MQEQGALSLGVDKSHILKMIWSHCRDPDINTCSKPELWRCDLNASIKKG